MRLLIAFAAVLLLPGCAAFSDLRDRAVAAGATGYDEALITSEIVMCRGASVGSIVRRYAVSDEQWQAYLRLCGYLGGAQEISRPEAVE